MTMHRPNLKTRQQVQAWAAVGATQTFMAKQLGISDPTLREHYRTELDSGVCDANATVASKLYELAIGGNVTACIFWLKTRARWRMTDDNPAEPELVDPDPDV